jgi:hypothetical protein
MTAMPIPGFPVEIILCLKPHQLDFPLDWSPENARDALHTLAQLEENIWLLYGDDIIEMERRDRVYISSTQNSAAADPVGDDFPF